jgi:hypothetical protein
MVREHGVRRGEESDGRGRQHQPGWPPRDHACAARLIAGSGSLRSCASAVKKVR